MAKNPTPQNDPAALAFSAVEDALKESVFNLDGPAPREPERKPADPARTERLRAADKIAQQAGSVANDDRISTSRLLYNLQSRSSSTPTVLALLLSIAWLLVSGTVAWLRFSAEMTNFGQFLGSIEFIALIAIMVLPVMGFFAVATLFRRAQDLRNAASSITQAAIRLAEPEVAAADKVASVGQAVRREVNALGDGLERALSRAGELEVMIHNEVTALERTYSDNESRMRALIAELASQRESVLTNTERVREAITESHTGLVFDLDMISQRIAGTIVESGGNLTRALETAGEGLTQSFSDRAENFVGLIENRSSDFINALDDSARRLTLTFEDQSSTMSSTLEARSRDLANTLDSRMDALAEALDTRAATISLTLDERTASLSNAIGNRTEALAGLLTDGGNTLLDRLQRRGAEVSDALDSIGTRIADDISGRASQAELLLATMSRQLDESISIQLNAMDSRLQSAVIEINGALDDTSERARITLSTAGQESLGQFDTRLSEIASLIDERLHQLDGVIGDKGEKLVERLDAQRTSFAARANVLEMALNEESGRFNDIVAERTREMGEVLGAKTKAVTESITARTREMSDSLDNHAGVIADALDSRTGSLNTLLGSRVEELDRTLAARSSAIEQTLTSQAASLDETLSTRSAELAESIRERSQELSRTLNAGTQTFDAAISSRSQRLADTLSERTNAMSLEIETRTDALANQLEERTATLVAQLEGNGGRIREALNNGTVELADIVATRTQELSSALATRTDSLSQVLQGRTDELSQTLQGRTDELSDALARRTSELSETLATQTTSMSETISLHASALGETIEQQGLSAKNSIDSSLRAATDIMGIRLEEMSSVVSGKVTEVNEHLGQGLDNAIARISDAERGVAARIESASSSVGESARQAASLIEAGVNAARQAITDMVDQRLGTLPEAITARADITADRLAALNASISTSITQSMADLEAGADRIEETIATRISLASQTIADDVIATAGRMDTAVRSALDQIRLAAGNIDQIVSVKAVGTVENLEGRLSEINRTVEEQTGRFAELVTQRSSELQHALNSHGNILRDALSENAREAETIMSASSSRILSDVTAALNKLNDSNVLLQQVLDAATGNLATLENNVSHQTANYSDAMRQAMGQTEQAGQLVTQHVGAMQQSIRGMIEQFGSILGRLEAEAAGITRASHSLETTSTTALDTLEERRGAMDALAQSFAARADDIDARMRMFAQNIADTVNDTERRLIAARRAMDEALAATSGSVNSAIEASTGLVQNAIYTNTDRFSTALSSQTEEFEAMVQRAADNAAAALSRTSSTVRNVLAEQTEQVNSSLESNASRVGDILSSTAGSVTDVLTSTSATLADAISDSTQSVRNAIAGNAGQLRRALEETTQEVTGQLGAFHEAAGAEGRRANAVLQEAQQRLVSEMQRAIEDATHRFAETARAMRETAREVGGELEATRAELARGVNELPEETRASAAAMRRVVAEQIEALAELNAIVRAQPASHDITDRRGPAQRSLRQPEPAPAPYQPPRAPAQPAQDSYRAEPAQAATRLVDPIRSMPEPAPQPAQAPARAEAPAGEGGGWLRDVLRNASAKQADAQQPAGQTGAKALLGLTEEIARAIDDAALAEAWSRYQSGESNVFSRRIYTLGGQGTYDEVRKRIQRDADFARTAQAYMGEFEQLLKRAAAGPRAAAETREHLLSDRGKVYTTLAHASGRLS